MLKSFNHFSFTVSNIDRSVAFYKRIVGFEVISEAKRPSKYVKEITGIEETVSMNVAYLKGYGITLELIEYTGSTKSIDKSACDNIGAGHICFDVEDIEEMVKEYKMKDVSFLGKPVRIPAGPNKNGLVVYALDPDGIVLEFIQSPAVVV